MRIYVDTSVFGGVFDPEFERGSKLFFEEVRARKFGVVISPVTSREIKDAPKNVRELFAEILPFTESIEFTPEVIKLKNLYMQQGVLTQKSEDDALHVALASFHHCEVIVSWNFKHIVHQLKIPAFNAANILAGHPPIQIYSPLQVIDYGKEL